MGGCVPCNALNIPIQNQPLDGTYSINNNPTGNNNIILNQPGNFLTQLLQSFFRPQQPQYYQQPTNNLSYLFKPQQYYHPIQPVGQPGCDPFYGCNPPTNVLQNLLNQPGSSCSSRVLVI